MTKKARYVLFLLIEFCAVFLPEIMGQSLQQDRVDLKVVADNCASVVNKWDLIAIAFIILTVLIGILGIATGVLQKFKGNSVKIVSAIIAVTISALTFINNGFLNGNYREKANAGTEIVNDIRFKIWEGYVSGNEPARIEWLNQIRELTKKFAELKRSPKLVAHGVRTETSFHWISIVYAQTAKSRLPAWVSKPSNDYSSIRFVGVGENDSLEKAKEFSLNKAKNEAIEYLIQKYNAIKSGEVRLQALDTTALASYLVKSGAEEASNFYFDNEKNVFRFYSLFVLNKNVLNADLKMFSIQYNTDISPLFEIERKEKFEPTGNDLYLRIEEQEKSFKEVQTQLVPQEFDEYSMAINSQMQGKPQESLPYFEGIVQTKPDFSLGWQGLAITYDALGDMEKASQAYLRAMELSSPAQNSDLYLTYVDFLIRQKRADEAFQFLQKAILNNPYDVRLKERLVNIRKNKY